MALLAPLIDRETAESLDLTNRISIEIQTASFRTVRSYSIVAALCDEIAYWRSDESANHDKEVLGAIRPAMATVPGSLLLCASSPHARRGALWDAYKRYFGQPGNVLVWQADTKTMNPTVPDRVIAEAYEEDPAKAAAEYGAQFRTDVETFIAREVVDAAVVANRHELPPISGVGYFAFCDPSGGSSDSMTLAICHKENDRAIVDASRERRPPFSPEAVVQEFAELLKTYRISRVTGDRYAGMWPRERFQVRGIDYQVSDKNKSELYLHLLPILNSGQAELLDHQRCVAQLCALERTSRAGGRDTIDHPRNGGRDDIINAVAGAIVAAGAVKKQKVPIVAPFALSRPRPSFDNNTGAGYQPGFSAGDWSNRNSFSGTK